MDEKEFIERFFMIQNLNKLLNFVQTNLACFFVFWTSLKNLPIVPFAALGLIFLIADSITFAAPGIAKRNVLFLIKCTRFSQDFRVGLKYGATTFGTGIPILKTLASKASIPSSSYWRLNVANIKSNRIMSFMIKTSKGLWKKVGWALNS